MSCGNRNPEEKSVGQATVVAEDAIAVAIVLVGKSDVLKADEVLAGARVEEVLAADSELVAVEVG